MMAAFSLSMVISGFMRFRSVGWKMLHYLYPAAQLPICICIDAHTRFAPLCLVWGYGLELLPLSLSCSLSLIMINTRDIGSLSVFGHAFKFNVTFHPAY